MKTVFKHNSYAIHTSTLKSIRKKKKGSGFQQHRSGLPGTQNFNEFQHDPNMPA